VGPHDDQVDILFVDVLEDFPVGSPREPPARGIQFALLSSVRDSDRRLPSATLGRGVEFLSLVGVESGGFGPGVDDVERVNAGVVRPAQFRRVGDRHFGSGTAVRRDEYGREHASPFNLGAHQSHRFFQHT